MNKTRITPYLAVLIVGQLLVAGAASSPEVVHVDELFRPRTQLSLTVRDRGRAQVTRAGDQWRIKGPSPVTIEFAPADRVAWDISGYRLVGVPLQNRKPGVVTVEGRLNNAGLTGWSHHAVGFTVAPAGEAAVLGFPFPVPEDRYRGPEVFSDQLAKPNGHRVHWRRFHPEDVRGLRMVIRSATGAVDLLVDDPFLAWPVTVELDERLMKMPFLDELGQVRAVEWPGKIHGVDALRCELSAELKSAAVQALSRRLGRFGGWLDGPRRKATGHFRTEKIDGRWWLIDPEGYLFFSVGACLAGNDPDTVINARRLESGFFTWLPGEDDYLRWAGRPKRAGREFASYPAMNYQRVLGEQWRTTARAGIHNRLRSWGVNTLGAWSSESMQRDARTPYTLIASIWWQPGGHRRFPSPFRPEFVDALRRALRKHVGVKNDPFCLGFFIGNELEWPDRFTPKVFELPESDHTKGWVRERLREKYATLTALNAAWKTGHTDWGQILSASANPIPSAAFDDIEPFYLDFTRAFFAGCKRAMNEELPHKLFLGCRTHRGPSVLGRGAAGHVDVFSVNVYDSEVRSWQVPGDVDIPLLAGEFHFGAVDRGVPSPGLSGSWNQRQRGLAFANYLSSALADPRFVGVHWFQWMDQSAAGRADRENHQCGFVDVTGRCYPEFTDRVARVTAGMYRVRLNRGGHLEILDELVSDPDLKRRTAVEERVAGEKWKAGYFLRHPEADSNRDGQLTWAEYNAHKAKAKVGGEQKQVQLE